MAASERALPAVRRQKRCRDVAALIVLLDDRDYSVVRGVALPVEVHDQQSFIAVVELLAEEREQAAEVERKSPERYQLGGAYDWKNADISAFLWAALTCFEPKPFHEPATEPSWRMFAECLYCGTIVE
jgi:hypothetical protein